MQVSIYMDEGLLKRVDRLAKRERRSRSKVIETLVEASLARGGAEPRLGDFVGAWKDDRSAKEIVAEIYKGRDRNRRSERAE